MIIKGNKNSKKLDKCIKITQPNRKSKNPIYVTQAKYKKELGIREFIVRAVPIVIEEEKYINNLKNILRANTTPDD